MKKLCEKCKKNAENVWDLCDNCFFLVCNDCPFGNDYECNKSGDYTCLQCWIDNS